MSNRGRKKKPSALSQLQGNPSKRAVNRREPKPEGEVKRPYGLGKGLQDRFWREHAGELERLQILTRIDSTAFRFMAEHQAVAIGAVQQLREGGMTIEGRDGAKKNPLAQIFRDNSMAYLKYATQFGMTPSSRSGMETPPEAEQLSLVEQLFAAVRESDDVGMVRD